MESCPRAKSGVSIETSARAAAESDWKDTDDSTELNGADAHLGGSDQGVTPALVRWPWSGGQPDVKAAF